MDEDTKHAWPCTWLRITKAPWIFIITLVLFTHVVFFNSAIASTALEQLLEKAEPCAGLRTELMGGLTTIAVDELQDLIVNEFSLEITGDQVTTEIDAKLSCMTSDAAVLRGDVSGRLLVDAQADFSNCVVETITVSITEIGGRYAAALTAFTPQLRRQISEDVKHSFQCFCYSLKD